MTSESARYMSWVEKKELRILLEALRLEYDDISLYEGNVICNTELKMNFFIQVTQQSSKWITVRTTYPIQRETHAEIKCASRTTISIFW
jgi:hypothetical protein